MRHFPGSGFIEAHFETCLVYVEPCLFFSCLCFNSLCTFGSGRETPAEGDGFGKGMNIASCRVRDVDMLISNRFKQYSYCMRTRTACCGDTLSGSVCKETLHGLFGSKRDLTFTCIVFGPLPWRQNVRVLRVLRGAV